MIREADATVILKKGEGRLLKAGGSWIFDNEIDRVEGAFEGGDVVRVHDFDGYPMGKGYINLSSKIRVRMLTRRESDVVDAAFIKERLRAAWEYRKRTVDTSSCRLVFGEADFLPGITVDKYEDVLVVEALALGADRMKGLIAELLKEILLEDGIAIRGVYERSDAKERIKEGMERYCGFIGEPFNTQVPITENGVHYLVDVAGGQKTGFFLDQKYNRLAMHPIARGARVLDCFTHTGSFALNCAAAGAREVLAVDASETAIAQAVKNAALNGFLPENLIPRTDRYLSGSGIRPAYSQAEGTQGGVLEGGCGETGPSNARSLEELCSIADAIELPHDFKKPFYTQSADGRRLGFQTADLLELLPAMQSAGECFDVVILDPPAFAKARGNVKAAEKGYRKINRAGMGLVRDGGYLATCTCSHFMTRELFETMLGASAREAHVRLRQVEARTQGPDHPILWSAAESSYLKFYIFQVVRDRR